MQALLKDIAYPSYGYGVLLLPQVPHQAGGSTLLVTLVSMVKNAEPLRVLFGKNRNIELKTKNAYRHAGKEYRLDNRNLIAATLQPGETHLHHWQERIKDWFEGWAITHFSGMVHLDEVLHLGSYHDLQAVLFELDRGSKNPSRNMQGPSKSSRPPTS